MFAKRVVSLLAGASFVLFVSMTAQAEDPTPAEKFGRESTVKVRVASEAARAQLAAHDARLVADYGAFAVMEAAAGTVPTSDEIEVMAEENLVLLNAGVIDTTTAAARQLRTAQSPSAGKSLHMVQFAGPVRPEWYSQLEDTGVQVVTYIPSNTYLVYGDANQIAGLQALAAKAPHIQWDGAYLDQYKIDPAANELIAQAAAAAPMATETINSLFAIQLVADSPANKVTLGVIDGLKLESIYNSYSILNYLNVIVRLPAAAVPQVAARPEVVSIRPYIIPKPFCERQDQIVAGNLSGNSPSGPGYLAWLTSKGFTQAQFNASAFVVDVSDSGVDNATTSPNHFGLYVAGTRPGTSRIMYNRLVGTAHSGSTLKGCDGHGNLNTHIIMGYDDLSGTPFADSSGYHYGLGVCPFVRAGSSVIFDPSSFTNPSYPNLQSMAYHDNARISSNSWGADTFGSYDTDAQAYDYLVRDAQPAGSTYPVDGNQEMVIVFANGNAGSTSGSVGSPATAKNVISVGAGENVQAFSGSDGCAISDTGANSANDIISFSSRGPCSDGRKKPEIVAPGTHVSGGVAQAASPGSTGTADSCYDGSGVCGGVSSIFFPSSGQQFYTASSGTSHSCPAVAGGCALIRQFFINQGMSPPSPAMTKAMLVNSARWMNGTGANDTLWSNNQGMGEMNLGDAFSRGAVTPTMFKDEDTVNNLFTASGQTRTFTGNVADTTKPFRATLAWTDAPGATSGNAYKNNLDLTVSVGGSTYKGNVFSSTLKNVSATGGTADAKNNVESVFLAAGVSGAFTVTVTATSINSDGVPNVGTSTDQDFALVVYNASTCTIAITPATLPDATVGTAYSQTLSASGGTSPYTWTLPTGTLPAGLTLSSGGVISGTPTAAGSSSFTVQATDSASCSGTQAYSINVVCPTISITPASLPNGTTGILYSQTLVAGGGTSPYTWSLQTGTLPAGLTLSSAGVISGTPTAAATSSFTAKATDTYGCIGTLAYSITIVCPSISISPLSPLPGGTTGVAYTQTLTAGGGTSPYTWSLQTGTLPAGLTLSSAGVISGTPTAAGTSSFTAKAVDTYGCIGTLAYSLTIVCPSISITPLTLPDGTVGSTYSQTLSATGGTSPYTWSLQTGTLPAGLTLSSAGVISGTPTAAGTSSFTVKATDTYGCTGTLAYSLTIVCPSISMTPATLPNGTLGSAYSQTLSAGGGTSPYTWALQTGALPAGLSLSTGGVISGTPTATGTSNFTVKATDAHACIGSRDYSITVVCPTISITPASLPNGTVGASYSQTLSASGGASPYTWSMQTGALPAGLSLSSGGVISGTPTTTGASNFTVKATDAHSCIGTKDYSITVACPSISISPASLPDATEGAAYSQTLSAGGGTSPYTWSRISGALPTGLSLSTGGVISGTPTVTGTSNFTVQATDAYGCSGTRAYSLTVSCGTITISPTSGVLPGGVINVAYNQTLTAVGGVSPYTWALQSGSLPAGLSLSSGGVISGTPTAVGATSFTVIATDNTGCSGTKLLHLTIAWPTCTALGDVNEDGFVNGGDIQDFIDCLIAGSTPLGNCACGDYNASGAVDAADVSPFVNALLGI